MCFNPRSPRGRLPQKSSEVAVIHELPLRQISFLREFCVSPNGVKFHQLLLLAMSLNNK
ncbi:hypothetical protein [uncultured Nostoc sp.]|uniref:hypothetical protein n=1 Tax=uncultured Nostoc sp. TaxID=340711 RepID=UPI0035CA65DD